MLNCYYAHSDQDDGLQVSGYLSSMDNPCCISHDTFEYICIGSATALQRRCYWLLDADDGTVLVHYLASKRLGRANSDPRCQSDFMLPNVWDTARVDDYDTLPYSTKIQRSYQAGLQDTCMNFEQVQLLQLHCTCCILS